MNTTRKIGAALLAFATLSAALLWSAPEPADNATANTEEASAEHQRSPTRHTAPEDTTPAHEEHAPTVQVEGTGRTAAVVDQLAEDASAAQRYLQRIDDNIDHLEAAAAAARAEGRFQRAELMEKRIAGLQRRMQEFGG